MKKDEYTITNENKKIIEYQNIIFKLVPRIKNEMFLRRIIISLDDYLKENPE